MNGSPRRPAAATRRVARGDARRPARVGGPERSARLRARGARHACGPAAHACGPAAHATLAAAHATSAAPRHTAGVRTHNPRHAHRRTDAQPTARTHNHGTHADARTHNHGTHADARTQRTHGRTDARHAYGRGALGHAKARRARSEEGGDSMDGSARKRRDRIVPARTLLGSLRPETGRIGLDHTRSARPGLVRTGPAHTRPAAARHRSRTGPIAAPQRPHSGLDRPRSRLTPDGDPRSSPSSPGSSRRTPAAARRCARRPAGPGSTPNQGRSRRRRRCSRGAG
ncbi:hypothetical protein JD76_01597 [Micromonospora endolithica]|nr:hypothetical protein JD76_01597 [Micromonospora endolithica]